MVFLSVKFSETDLFYFETTTTTQVFKIIQQLVVIENNRRQLRKLIDEMDSFAKYGRHKTTEELGKLEDEPQDVKEDPKLDPTGRRVSVAPAQSIVEAIQKCVEDSKKIISKERAQQKKPLTIDELKEHFLNFKGCIMMAHPEGLPKEDPIADLLDVEKYEDPDFFQEENTQLWFAGVPLAPTSEIKDIKSVGKNEKSTILVKLGKKGGSAPQREGPVSAEDQKKLMAIWYKKQEEGKKLIEDDDITHTNSEWSNPQQYKQQFHNLSNISFK